MAMIKSGFTAGIEIECLLAQPHQIKSTPTLQRVHECLSAPFDASCDSSRCHKNHTFLLPMTKLGDKSGSYTGWKVVQDYSVKVEIGAPLGDALPQVCEATPLEIISRVLSTDKITALHSPSLDEPISESVPWGCEIYHVFQRLTSTFNTATTRLFVNETCGGHIHVGQGQARLPLSTLINLLIMCTAFERQIDLSVMSESRIQGYKGHLRSHRLSAEEWDMVGMNKYCLPMSTLHIKNADVARHGTPDLSAPSDQSRLLSMFPHRNAQSDKEFGAAIKGLDVRAWLDVVVAAETEKDLMDLLEWQLGHRSALNVSNSLPFGLNDDKTQKPTVEFRQYAGSLNAEEMLARMDFVVQLTKYCHQNDTAAVKAYALLHWADPSYSFLDLVGHLKVDGETLTFFQSLLTAESFMESPTDSQSTPAQGLEERLENFMGIVDAEHLASSNRRKVEEKIAEKLRNGGYGQFPKAFVVSMLGADFAASDAGRRLIIAAQTGNTALSLPDDIADHPADEDETAGLLTDGSTDISEPCSGCCLIS